RCPRRPPGAEAAGGFAVAPAVLRRGAAGASAQGHPWQPPVRGAGRADPPRSGRCPAPGAPAAHRSSRRPRPDQARLVSLLTTVPLAGAEAGVLACYLALDTSDSMSGPPLEAATTELARLRDAAREHPRLATGCRLSITTFDDEAHVHVPL